MRELRRHLGLSQRDFAQELNARQQTVSEWETGRYRPRGPSARLLTLIAERAAFPYAAAPAPGWERAAEPAPEAPPDAPAGPR